MLDTVFVALDGRYARLTYDSSALNGRADATASNLGLTAGVQTPFLGLRVWGTYIFNGELDPDSINNVDVKFNDFKGYRVGTGFYIAVVSINLEYQHGHYDSTTVQNAGGFSGGNTNDITANDNSYIFSVSFPLAL